MTSAEVSIEEAQERKAGLRARQRHAREDAILDAAHALIAEVGYEAMTMDGLAERTGISKPTLYHHFPSKEAIAIRSTIVRIESSLVVIREIDPNLPAISRFEAVARWLITRRLTQGNKPVLKTIPALMPIFRVNPDYQAAMQRFIAELSGIAETAIAEGDIALGLPPRLIVQMLVSVLRDTDYETLIAAESFTRDEVTETLVSLLMRGIRRTDC